MAKDDVSLGVEMGKLEIEPPKFNKVVKEENPFLYSSISQERKSVFTKICIKNHNCSCFAQDRRKNTAICKKKQNKIIKEPILKLLKTHTPHNCSRKEECTSVNADQNLCALVDNCNQLRISTNSSVQNSTTEPKNEIQWWKNSVTSSKHKEKQSDVCQPGSCSQQALNPPCDVTIDELASYFETLVHIPKKMSSMAEMMYI